MQKKTMLMVGAAALIALGGIAGLANAHMGGKGWGGGYGHGRGGGMMGQEMMTRYDADKDGKITQQEIDQNRTQWHGEFDADKNASLSLQEFQALWLKARGDMIVREFQMFDRDGNGQVTLEEYQAPMAGMVARRDLNGDGALSPDDRGRRGERHRWREGRGMEGEKGPGPEGQTPPGEPASP